MASTLAVLKAPQLAVAQPRTNIRPLADKFSVGIDESGANVIIFTGGDGVVLVDCGSPKSASSVISGLKTLSPDGKVQTLFNTHYHLDQTGNNEAIASTGAKIIAHERTKQYMATGYWVPAENRYEKARPKGALPTQTFLEDGSLKSGGEQIDYGYLLLAHTSGDMYVYFRNANILAVGDVASPERDPALDWFTGAWIGGRVDAMDTLLKLANDQTKIVPAYGPVMTKAQFKAERDLMEEVRARLFKYVREGDGPKDMLADGVLANLPRTWKDPNKFLYDAAKGLWAHHDKLDPNVV
jgi:glyoxylase-like metal-dependent hydrolase (beta-lactamase superfamily II)